MQVALDAAAFAIFALMRNDSAGFWQFAGPWSDVPHFNVAGAAIAYVIYVGGSLAALLSRYRGLRAVEALGLIAIPFLFNLVVTLGADWHMRELGALLSPDVPRSFQGQVAVGRAVVLLFCRRGDGAGLFDRSEPGACRQAGSSTRWRCSARRSAP